jgi:hypothetical protein
VTSQRHCTIGRRSPPGGQLRFARRARSAIIWSLAAFGALQLSLLAAIETRFPEFRDPLYGRKRHQLERCLADAPTGAPLVLLLGSSRVYNGADANGLKAQLRLTLGEDAVVYNFGLAAAGPLTELIVLNRLLADGVKPELVLIEVFPAMLAAAEPLLESDPLTASRLWQADLPLLEHCDASFESNRFAWYRGAAVGWHTYRYGIVGRLSTSWLPPEGWGNGCYAYFDPCGWQPLDEKSCPAESRTGGLLVAEHKYAKTLGEFRPGPGVRALQEILKLCRSENLPAALLLMPEGDQFTSWYSPKAKQKVEELIRGAAREASVSLIDARRWMQEEDFFDSHHLLAGAAQRFSGRLGREAGMLMRDEVHASRAGSPRR